MFTPSRSPLLVRRQALFRLPGTSYTVNSTVILFVSMKFKNHFKSLNYYSIPSSILFILRKRLNFITLSVIFFTTFVLTLI